MKHATVVMAAMCHRFLQLADKMWQRLIFLGSRRASEMSLDYQSCFIHKEVRVKSGIPELIT